MSEYDPIVRAQDAAKFAQSRFGQHYLTRLREVSNSHVSRARAAARAGQRDDAISYLIRSDEAEGEILYFDRMQEITESPSLMKRIRENLKKKSEKPDKQ